MLNSVSIMGRLVRDPELKTTQSGASVVSFTIACDRDFGGKNGAEKQTDFLDCSAWRGAADFIGKYFSKGDMIAISGKLQTRNWEGKDGTQRKATEILVDSAYFCGNKSSGNNQSTGASRQSAKNHGFEVDDSDLPF